MPIVDPSNKDIDRKPRYHVRAGKKVFAVVSTDRSVMEDSGNEKVSVRCVVVRDLEPDSKTEDPPSDHGMSCDARLWNTERGRAGMARFARGLKYTQPFDTDDANVWQNQILASNNGVFVGVVKVDSPTIDGKTRHFSEIESFSPYEGEIDPGWQALVDASYEEQAKALIERQKRQEKGGYGGRGRSRGGRANSASHESDF